jgi:hypothetical protein
VGDESRRPRFLAPDEKIPAVDEHLVMPIPEEYRSDFESNMLDAIRDIAGVSTFALRPFIFDREAIAEAFGKVPSILSRTDVDFVTTKLQLYPAKITNPNFPRFCHIDLAETGDYAGVAIGHVYGFKEIKRSKENTETLPLIRFDCTLEVRPPPGGEIIFEKIRQILYRLRELKVDDVAVNVQWVSLDSFQSTDTIQILQSRGFVAGMQSLDKTVLPYDIAKQAFYDRRVLAPEHHRARDEWLKLERDVKHNKVDHPPNGSKDISDAMCGVIYGLTMRREIWSMFGLNATAIPAHLSRANNTGKKSIEAAAKKQPAPAEELEAA